MFSFFHKKTPAQNQNETVIIRTMHDDLSQLANKSVTPKKLSASLTTQASHPTPKKSAPSLQKPKIETMKTLPDVSKKLSPSPFFTSKQEVPLPTSPPVEKKATLQPLPRTAPPALKKEPVPNLPYVPNQVDQRPATQPFYAPKTKPPLSSVSPPTPLKSLQVPQPTQNPSPAKQPISLPHFNQLGSTSFSNVPSNSSPSNKEASPSTITFEKLPHHGLMIFIVVLSIIVAVSLGGYYFWITRNPSVPSPTPAAVTPSDTPLPESTFSLTSANYLPVNVETASAESLQDLFQKTHEEIRTAEIKQPIEFFITDQNNQPISLSIFSALSELKLPPALLESLDDQFSIFLYPDGEEDRVALVLNMKNVSNAATFLAKNEKILVGSLALLYLGETLTPTTPSFNSSLYQDHPIRYQNLHPDDTLSLDYTLTANQLLFATSKNTLRAVLDYLAQP